MYSFVSGIVEEKNDNFVVINNNGIGYEIACSTNTISSLPQVGENARVYTYLHVREDIFSLFGFLTKDERKLFLQLITVTGIGAKTATSILSGISVTDLSCAISQGDTTLLSKVKGLGKKTAERIILELRGKVEEGDFVLNNFQNSANSNFDEAVEVLVNMGLNKYDATKLVKMVISISDTTEEIIAKALKNMGNL